jgi:16S rRNA (uracil1498-N3)-methyltransferase
MNTFFASDAHEHSLLVLDDTEAHHATHVLRMKRDDTIHVFDGKGNLYQGVIVEASKKQVAVNIQHLLIQQKQNSGLHIAIAPTKQMERLEWFIEKAVEIGVSAISPVVCKRSERKDLKIERLEKLVVSACKQSKQYQLPTIYATQTFAEFLQTTLPETRCIAWCETNSSHIKNHIQADKELVCAIGPEGDFTSDEIEAAKQQGFKPITLGNSILRTETAGVYVAAVYQSLQFS